MAQKASVQAPIPAKFACCPDTGDAYSDGTCMNPILAFAARLRPARARLLSAVALGLGYIWGAIDPRKRGWHDHIAGTLHVYAA